MGQLIIYDPCCISPRGHNARSCKLFQKKASTLYDSVKIITGKHVEFIPELVGIDCKDVLSCGYDLLGKGAERDIEHIDLFDVAFMDLKTTLKSNDGSIVFIPGCDFYTFRAVLKLLFEEPSLIRDRLFLRFISVLENDTRYDHDKGRFLALFAEHAAIAARYGVRFSAETIFYSEFLEKISGAPVDTCPYPLEPEPDASILGGNEAPVCVGSIGAARREKGYFDLLSLSLSLQSNKVDTTLLLQRMSLKSPEFLANYEMMLHSQPNVQSLNYYLSEADMDAAFDAVDYQLLAYDISTYRYRGSAILFDAVQRFTPVLAHKENGYVKEVERFGIGFVFGTYEQLIKLIKTAPKRNEAMHKKLFAFQQWAESQTKHCLTP
jgi:hypothetical protein